jgi:hypothetical protein
MRAQISMDLLYSAMGLCKAVPYPNHTAASVEDPEVHNCRAVVRFQLHTPQRSAHSIFSHGNQPTIPPLPKSVGETSKPPSSLSWLPYPLWHAD